MERDKKENRYFQILVPEESVLTKAARNAYPIVMTMARKCSQALFGSYSTQSD